MQPPSQNPTNPSGQWYQPSPLSSQGNYPAGEEAYYNQFPQSGGPTGTQGKLNVPPAPPKPRNGWKVVSLVLFILVLILAATTTALVLTRPSSSAGLGTQPPSAATRVAQQPTSVSTSASTPLSTPTVSASNSYLATQPGPGCDLGGGTWTPAGPISNIQCGTQITVNANEGRGYLYLALPANETFSPNNTISIASAVGYNGSTTINNCGGLAEQSATAGLLVEYCNNGQWSIYTISSAGAIIKILASGITSTRTNEKLSLALSGTTLAFTIDTEVHKVTISAMQPTKVSIEVYCQNANNWINVDDFSYLAQSS